MNFSKLKDLRNHFSEDYIIKMDEFLSSVHRTYEDRITLGKIRNYLEVNYDVTNSIVEKCCELGILTKRYALVCPDCGLVLKFTEVADLEEAIKDTNYCYACALGEDNLDLKINIEEVLDIYRINR